MASLEIGSRVSSRVSGWSTPSIGFESLLKFAWLVPEGEEDEWVKRLGGHPIVELASRFIVCSQ
jgi:hypothetical protein